MSEITANQRDARGDWAPARPIALAPINHWPLQPRVVSKWLFGFPGFLWPHNAFWLCVTLLTWFYLTPPLAEMKTFELWWVSWLLVRNAGFILLLFGGMHLYFYVFRKQGDELRFSTRGMVRDNPRFIFRDQVRDNVFRTMTSAVPVITAYEAITYWAFANGYLGWFTLNDPVLFWGWFVVLLLLAPVVHAVHFYLGHRLLHVPFLYRHVHERHHRNVEVGPWSGLAMHPVEHIIYLSTLTVQWLLALHPVNALFQLQLAAFYPALGHCGFEKLKIGKSLDIDGGGYFHYLHHKYFECNYGGSLAPLDKWFGTFHDGSEESLAVLRARLRARKRA